MVDGTRARPRRVVPPTSWRATNLTLLAVLGLALATGVGAVATGSPRGSWVVVAHGVVGVAVVLLVPAKKRVVDAGLRRRRPNRGASVALAVLALGSLAAGFASASGLPGEIGGRTTLWVHIALALLLVPLLGWHVLARPVRPRRSDLGRRTLLRARALAAVAGAGYAAVEGLVRVTGAPGAARRFTGSHPVADAPVTSWLDDATPRVDPATWRLGVTDADGPRALSRDDVAALTTATVRATLDCTSGWCVTGDWTGVPVASLLRRVGPEHRSVRVRSSTGYDRYLPLSDLDGLLVATAFAGRPLGPGHGFPARLVAPGRRGFWWVKWIDGVELSRRPWWTQPPFPPT